VQHLGDRDRQAGSGRQHPAPPQRDPDQDEPEHVTGDVFEPAAAGGRLAKTAGAAA